MLFPRIRIERGASGHIADSLRTRTFSADLQSVAGESKGGARMRDAILARDCKPARAYCNSSAGTNRSAYTRAFGERWSGGFAMHNKSSAPRSPCDDLVAGHHTSVAQIDRRQLEACESKRQREM